jgi:hypothetical protein
MLDTPALFTLLVFLEEDFYASEDDSEYIH